MIVDVGELLAEPGLGGDPAPLRLQPLAEGCHQRRAASLAGREALARGGAPDVGLDGIELGDPAQPFGGDVRAVAVEDLLQLAPCVRPAMRDAQRRAAPARRLGQPVVAGIAIDLQDAVEAGQEGFCILARAAGGVEVDHARRGLTAPGPVIPGQRPEVAGLRRAAPRIQHRGRRLVHEEPSGSPQMLGQPIHDRPEVESGFADPIGQNGTVQIEA